MFLRVKQQTDLNKPIELLRNPAPLWRPAHHRRDQALLVHLAHTLVRRVGDVDVPRCVRGHPIRMKQARRGSRAAVAGKAWGLNQLVTANVDNANPVGAVIPDIGLRTVRQEGHVEGLGKTRNRLDLR